METTKIKPKMEAAIQPLVDMIRKRGFTCEVHLVEGNWNRTPGGRLFVQYPGRTHWQMYVNFECHSQTGAVNAITSKCRGTRTVTFKSSARFDDVSNRVWDDYIRDVEAEQKADQHYARRQAWLERAKIDFKDFDLGPLAHSDDGDNWKFINIQNANHDLGVYCLRPPQLPGLNAAQVKALITFLTKELPNIK